MFFKVRVETTWALTIACVMTGGSNNILSETESLGSIGIVTLTNHGGCILECSCGWQNQGWQGLGLMGNQRLGEVTHERHIKSPTMYSSKLKINMLYRHPSVIVGLTFLEIAMDMESMNTETNI